MLQIAKGTRISKCLRSRRRGDHNGGACWLLRTPNPAGPTTGSNSPDIGQSTRVMGGAAAELGPELAAVRLLGDGAVFHDPEHGDRSRIPQSAGRTLRRSPAGAIGRAWFQPALVPIPECSTRCSPKCSCICRAKTARGWWVSSMCSRRSLRHLETGVVGFAATASTTPWPATYQLVTPTPRLFRHTFQGPMPGTFPACPGTGTCTSGCGQTIRAARFAPVEPDAELFRSSRPFGDALFEAGPLLATTPTSPR